MVCPEAAAAAAIMAAAAPARPAAGSAPIAALSIDATLTPGTLAAADTICNAEPGAAPIAATTITFALFGPAETALVTKIVTCAGVAAGSAAVSAEVSITAGLWAITGVAMAAMATADASMALLLSLNRDIDLPPQTLLHMR
jgi:hypothetical protein